MKRAPKSANLVVLKNNDPISAATEAIQGRIRERAFAISQARPPDVQELYDWIRAESEIISVPPIELVEKNGGFELKFGIAGVNPDDVNVMVSPDQVLLKSECQNERTSEEGTIHISDFKSATVFRSVNLPDRIDVNSAEVQLDEGLVRVTAAKERTPARPKRAAGARKTAAKKNRSRVA